jgi:hypothetical protein
LASGPSRNRSRPTFILGVAHDSHRHPIDGGCQWRNADPITRPEAAADDHFVAFGAKNIDGLEAQSIPGVDHVDEIAAGIRAQGRARQNENVLDPPALDFSLDEETDGQGC